MLRSKHRAAILIRLNGSVKGVYLSGNCNNFILIHADTRAEHGQIRNRIRAAERVNCLACNLAEAFARDKRKAILLLCDIAAYFHHYAAHNEGEIFLRAEIPDSLLNFGEGHHKGGDSAAISRNPAQKIKHLHFGKLACVRRRRKVDCHKLNSPFCHHIGRNGRINAAADKNSAAAACARGHTACALNVVSAHKRMIIAHLNGYDNIGIMHIHL